VSNDLTKDQLIQKLKKLDVIYREPVELKHAGISDFYVDIKKAYGYSDVLNLIADCLWEIMDKRTTCIAAMGYGGVSPASVIVAKHGLRLTLIREEEKKHGKGGFVDGYIPAEEDYVSIIDDVGTTGKSLRKVANVIRQYRSHITGAYVVVKRGDFDLDIPFKWLFTVDEVV